VIGVKAHNAAPSVGSARWTRGLGWLAAGGFVLFLVKGLVWLALGAAVMYGVL
jgi:hypothetical protein